MEGKKSLKEKIEAIQDDIGVMKKDKTNPFYKSKYFDINQLLAELKPLFKKHGVIVTQPLGSVGEKAALGLVIRDKDSDDVEENFVVLPDIVDAQKGGSAITYYRRYALQSYFLLEAEDDDANTASGKKQKFPAEDED